MRVYVWNTLYACAVGIGTANIIIIANLLRWKRALESRGVISADQVRPDPSLPLSIASGHNPGNNGRRTTFYTGDTANGADAFVRTELSR